MPGAFVVAAAQSSSGKTLLTLGLLGALAKCGLKISSAKVGPDYIDPRFHTAVTGQPSHNLDLWAQGEEAIRLQFERLAARFDLVVVEGVMGLFDGPIEGKGSTADVASCLDLPVILIVDARAQGQSAAAVVRGFASHKKNCRIAGVIFNKVGSARHEKILRLSVEDLDIPVLGAVHFRHDLHLPSRHLGLVQAGEITDLQTLIKNVTDHISSHVDLDRLIASGETADKPICCTMNSLAPLGQRIAVADDTAFGFTYSHLIEGWRDAGAEILRFSPLLDEGPPVEASAVFLPGGYPEMHCAKLSTAENFKESLRKAAATDTLIYGECGGYMVLGEGLIDAQGVHYPMAGLLPVVTSFAKRQRHLGYRVLRHNSPLPWPTVLRGHEFHYTNEISNEAKQSLFSIHDAAGDPLGSAGAVVGRVFGSYCHAIGINPIDDAPEPGWSLVEKND